ncbi:MAG TPA: class I SAM-dependent methyltransferase [Kouleothrix sp.]|nr:class I SAM-dependent methyltransferase [Kouleothrix sp.]
MTQYQAYAPFYDITGQIRFAVLMAQYLREILGRHPAPRRRALDLACGTGTLALMLADDGWDVVGLDVSEAMLGQARAKAANLDTPGSAAFVCGDMRDIGAAVDAARGGPAAAVRPGDVRVRQPELPAGRARASGVLRRRRRGARATRAVRA